MNRFKSSSISPRPQTSHRGFDRVTSIRSLALGTIGEASEFTGAAHPASIWRVREFMLSRMLSSIACIETSLVVLMLACRSAPWASFERSFWAIGTRRSGHHGMDRLFHGGHSNFLREFQAQAMREAKAGAADRSQLLRNLDAKQRQVLALFENSRDVTAKEIAALFGFQQRNAAMGEG